MKRIPCWFRSSEQPTFDDRVNGEHAAYLINHKCLDGRYIRDGDDPLAFIEMFCLAKICKALLGAVSEDAVWTRTKKELAPSLDPISPRG